MNNDWMAELYLPDPHSNRCSRWALDKVAFI